MHINAIVHIKERRLVGTIYLICLNMDAVIHIINTFSKQACTACKLFVFGFVSQAAHIIANFLKYFVMQLSVNF